jgi:hypothetical protein
MDTGLRPPPPGTTRRLELEGEQLVIEFACGTGSCQTHLQVAARSRLIRENLLRRGDRPGWCFGRIQCVQSCPVCRLCQT